MAAATKRPGEVRADSIYTLDEIKARLGLGAAALRKARREGLIVRRIGSRGYVLGRHLIAWFERSAAPTSLPAQITEDIALQVVDSELRGAES